METCAAVMSRVDTPSMLRSSSPGNTSQEAAAALFTKTCLTCPHSWKTTQCVCVLSGTGCCRLPHEGMGGAGRSARAALIAKTLQPRCLCVHLDDSQNASLNFPLLSHGLRARVK